jgi:hypothetical protein
MERSFEGALRDFAGRQPLVDSFLDELHGLGHQLDKLSAALSHRGFHLAFTQNAVHGVAAHS